MEPSVAFLLYGLAAFMGYALITALSKLEIVQGFFFRALAGGSAGGVSAYYLTGVIPFVSYTEASINGDFGLGGYLFFFSTLGILIVWIYNIYQYQVVVR